MTQPVIAYANLNAGSGREQSQYVTATVDLRSSFGGHVNIGTYKSQDASAGMEVWGQRSIDGGNSFDSTSEKQLLHIFDTIGNEDQSNNRAVWVDRGYWLLAVQVAGPNTGSAAFTTAEIVTAYE